MVMFGDMVIMIMTVICDDDDGWDGNSDIDDDMMIYNNDQDRKVMEMMIDNPNDDISKDYCNGCRNGQ